MEAGCAPTPLGPSVSLCLPSFFSAQAGVVESSAFDRALVGSGGAVVARERERFADLLFLLVNKPLELPQVRNLLVQTRRRDPPTTHVEDGALSFWYRRFVCLDGSA